MPALCTICQTDVNDNALDREVTPCNHVFHQGCLDQWRQQNRCPNCNQLLDATQPVQPVQYDPDNYPPVLDGGQLGAGGDGGDGYVPPPNSPVDANANTMMCPGCNQLRTLAALSTHAAGLFQPTCVVCTGPCDPNTDYVFVECGHPIHANLQ
jgi:hypothetical protein